MGKIYNGMDMNVAETDSTPKELEEIFDILNNIGSFVVERDDVKFRDDEIKRIYNILRKYLYKNVLFYIVQDIYYSKTCHHYLTQTHLIV
jgi:spermidine synthase